MPASSYRFHPAAEVELQEAADWYEDRCCCPFQEATAVLVAAVTCPTRRYLPIQRVASRARLVASAQLAGVAKEPVHGLGATRNCPEASDLSAPLSDRNGDRLGVYVQPNESCILGDAGSFHHVALRTVALPGGVR